MLRHIWLLLLGTLLFAPESRAVEEKDLLPIDQAFVVSARALTREKIEFTWKIAPGYYLYRHRMGVTSVDGAFATTALQLPDGKHKKDQFFGEVQTYRDQVVGIQSGTAKADARTVSFQVKYQGCADLGVCYPPHKKTISVSMPAAPADSAPLNLDAGKNADLFGGSKITTDSLPLPADRAFQFEAIVSGSNELLLRFTPAPGYYLYRDKTKISIETDSDAVTAGELSWPPAQTHKDEYFGDVAVFFDLVEAKLPLQLKDSKAHAIKLKASFIGCQENGICYPPMKREIPLQILAGGKIFEPGKIAGKKVSLDIGAWLQALLLALGGGLILNLMPCVLPVLSLKALSLVEGADNNRNARKKALWYSFGVMSSFALVGAIAVGLRHAGLALGWGFQLQQPVIVSVLALIMLAVGLSLSGVFQIGAGLAGAGQKLTENSGPSGDFFTGVLAVVVASPCTAPLMGGALAFAFATSPVIAMSIFLALGLGLALPFLMIAFIPALAKLLPKPGAWMETLKQVLAFPMYLTAAWLVSVLAAQRGSTGVMLILSGAIALAFALWLWERTRYSEKRFPRIFALLAGLAAIYCVSSIHRIETPVSSGKPVSNAHVDYSDQSLAQLLKDDRTVFINMTADWCITCKTNEVTIFARPAFKELLQQTNTVYMVGDYTNVDENITRFLEIHKAVGVPLYVVYSKKHPEGEVLPTLLTQGMVEKALRDAQAR